MAQNAANRHTAMHPATATTPFTLLWASIDKNEEDPPFWAFIHAQRPLIPPHRSKAMTTPSTAQPSPSSTHATSGNANARAQALAPSPTQDECSADASATADFLVTNLRPDLLG